MLSITDETDMFGLYIDNGDLSKEMSRAIYGFTYTQLDSDKNDEINAIIKSGEWQTAELESEICYHTEFDRKSNLSFALGAVKFGKAVSTHISNKENMTEQDVKMLTRPQLEIYGKNKINYYKPMVDHSKLEILGKEKTIYNED